MSSSAPVLICVATARAARNAVRRYARTPRQHCGPGWRKLRGEPDTPVFPNQRGGPLSHDGLDYLLTKHLTVARAACPSLKKKRVTPHVLRHTAAMDLLQSGVDRAVIALWLGHESVETTYVYLHADLKLKEKAMAKTTPSELPPNRYRPADEVLAFLNSL